MTAHSMTDNGCSMYRLHSFVLLWSPSACSARTAALPPHPNISLSGGVLDCLGLGHSHGYRYFTFTV